MLIIVLSMLVYNFIDFHSLLNLICIFVNDENKLSKEIYSILN
jgi:hypothetical protein